MHNYTETLVLLTGSAVVFTAIACREPESIGGGAAEHGN